MAWLIQYLSQKSKHVFEGVTTGTGSETRSHHGRRDRDEKSRTTTEGRANPKSRRTGEVQGQNGWNRYGGAALDEERNIPNSENQQTRRNPYPISTSLRYLRVEAFRLRGRLANLFRLAMKTPKVLINKNSHFATPQEIHNVKMKKRSTTSIIDKF